MTAPAHIYEIFIRATPERVWQALIDPEFTRAYFHGTQFESTFEPGAGFRSTRSNGTTAVDGVIEEFDPPHRLALTWHVLYDTDMANEPPGRVEWRLTPATEDRSITRVTLRHGDLALSPRTWAHVRLGWVEIVDGLKTLLETGTPLASVQTLDSEPVSDVDGEWHRTQAIAANSATWEILGKQTGAPDVADDLLDAAHAAAYHWARAVDRSPVNTVRGLWLLSRCYVVLGHGELARQYADHCAAVVADADLDDFDLAYAHEARARALACLGELARAGTERQIASGINIADPEDESIFRDDLESEPWFGLTA